MKRSSAPRPPNETEERTSPIHLTPKGFPLFRTFDLDAETMWTARDPSCANRPVMMSQGAYGWKVGTPRILAFLERYGVKATFFVPGIVIDRRPQVIEAILDGGHQIAHHFYTHRWILNLFGEEERDEMAKRQESIQRATGRRPKAWRSPSAELSPITIQMLVDEGFDYPSNFFDDDSPLPAPP